MPTKLDPDDEFFIPDVSGFDWSQAEIGRYARAPGEKTEICIDGAVGYSLRLIPSNKILAKFGSTLEAWPVIIATIEGGRSPRTLSLDWNAADGSSGSICAGPGLEGFARLNNGGPHPHPSRPLVRTDERPDTSGLDWSKAVVGRRARKPGEKTEVFIDGAVGYRLRLIPSNREIARFETTLEAWPVIIETIELGRSPRTLAFDAVMADGRMALVSAGPRIEMWARYNNGEPNPYSDVWVKEPRRVAEGAA